MPYGYRLDVSGGDYALVPTRTRNSNGDLEDLLPLLDRNVTIPLGTRRIAEYANLMTDELSKQTGLHIGCCQRLVAGVPWGMAKVRFEADNKRRNDLARFGRQNRCGQHFVDRSINALRQVANLLCLG